MARGHLLGLLVGEGMSLTLLGSLLGLAVAAALAHWERSLLYGVSTIDPLTFAAVPVFFGVVALAACVVPARRALALDPVAALRSE